MKGRAKTNHIVVFGACLALALGLSPMTKAESIALNLPVDCEVGRTCLIQQYVDHGPSPNGPSPKARDYQCGTLTYVGHNGTDFRLPSLAAQRAGVNVLAAASGQVLRMRDGMPDISVKTIGAPAVDDRECGNGALIAHRDEFETQYCHLTQHSVTVKAGDQVDAGQPIGRIGLSGQTEFPHLHLTVRHRGKVVDPFAFGAAEGTCGEGTSLWSAAVRGSLAYRPRAVLNVGFAAEPVTMAQIELGEAGRIPPRANAEAVIAFVRAIGLKAGDLQRLSIKGPDAQLIVDHSERPLDRDKAQFMLFAGKKRPPAGWPTGLYQAKYGVTAGGRVVLEADFSLSF